MIDLLFRFDTLAEAHAALAEHGLSDGEAFDPAFVNLTPITITMIDGQVPTGLWIAAWSPDLDPDLVALAQAAIDRSKGPGAAQLSECVIATVWPIDAINLVASISPVWAGSDYPFPGLFEAPDPVVGPKQP
jgi:hypothetical protein